MNDPTDLPGVTVVIPTRDRQEMLDRALRSVWAQTYAGTVNALVVFDQSEPHLHDEQAAAGRRVRPCRNTRTPGAAGARNTGILAAEDELLAFLDDDDEWLPDKLEAQVTALLAYPDCSAVSCGLEVVARSVTTLRTPDARQITRAHLLRSRATELHLSTILTRREVVVDRIGLFDEDIPGSYGEDYDWLLRAVDVGPVHALPQPLVRIYWHVQSYFTAKWQVLVDALQYMLRKHPEFAEDPPGLARLHGRLAFAHAALGDRRAAARHVRTCLSLSRQEPRAYLALLVVAGLPARGVLRAAALAGKGV